MPPDNRDLPATTYVILVILVAFLALIGAVFTGAGNRLFVGNESPENQEEISALQTQVAGQATLIAQGGQVSENGDDPIIVPVGATQTVVAQPLPPQITAVTAQDIVPQIKGEDGELQRLMSWWRETPAGSVNGLVEPPQSSLNEYCYGMAWNTNEHGYHHLIVFQTPIQATFADGGWAVGVCIARSIFISPEDIARIQVDWLGKRYGDIDSQPWEFEISKP